MSRVFQSAGALFALGTVLVIIAERGLGEEPAFKSELFEKGKLVYSDTFDGEIDLKRWGSKAGKEIRDGQLIVSPKFNNKQEAMEKLKRDHHLGLEPMAHINGIPDQFVCRMRYQFELPKLSVGRPVFQIGHHMITMAHRPDRQNAGSILITQGEMEQYILNTMDTQL